MQSAHLADCEDCKNILVGPGLRDCIAAAIHWNNIFSYRNIFTEYNKIF